MNGGSPETSPQLRDTLRLLRDARGGLVTSAEIRAVTSSVAVHSDIAAVRQWLRTAGTRESIPQAEHVATTPEKRRIYGYRIETDPEPIRVPEFREATQSALPWD